MDALEGLAVRLSCSRCGSVKTIRLEDVLKIRHSGSRGREAVLCDCGHKVSLGQSPRRIDFGALEDIADAAKFLVRSVEVAVKWNPHLSARLTRLDGPAPSPPLAQTPRKREGRKGAWSKYSR